SPSATTPRTSGSRSARCFLRTEVSGWLETSISPSGTSSASSPPSLSCSGAGLRTATAHVETPRIITPSRTAWPPTGASRWATRVPGDSPATAVSALALVLLAGGGVAALEALDAAAGVDQLLPARVERVAVRADLDVDL